MDVRGESGERSEDEEIAFGRGDHGEGGRVLDFGDGERESDSTIFEIEGFEFSTGGEEGEFAGSRGAPIGGREAFNEGHLRPAIDRFFPKYGGVFGIDERDFALIFGEGLDLQGTEGGGDDIDDGYSAGRNGSLLRDRRRGQGPGLFFQESSVRELEESAIGGMGADVEFVAPGEDFGGSLEKSTFPARASGEGIDSDEGVVAVEQDQFRGAAEELRTGSAESINDADGAVGHGFEEGEIGGIEVAPDFEGIDEFKSPDACRGAVFGDAREIERDELDGIGHDDERADGGVIPFASGVASMAASEGEFPAKFSAVIEFPEAFLAT